MGGALGYKYQKDYCGLLRCTGSALDYIFQEEYYGLLRCTVGKWDTHIKRITVVYWDVQTVVYCEFTVDLLWITATHPTQGDNSCAIYEAPFLPRVYKQTPPPWLLGPAMYMYSRKDSKWCWQCTRGLLGFCESFWHCSTSTSSTQTGKLWNPGELLNWIRAFLTTRRQRVVLNGARSKWARVKSGVPQESILGPTLFLVYINDISNWVHTPPRSCLLMTLLCSSELMTQTTEQFCKRIWIPFIDGLRSGSWSLTWASAKSWMSLLNERRLLVLSTICLEYT